MDISPAPKRVIMLGATGTAGLATTRALLAAGHHVTCLVRDTAKVPGDIAEHAAVREADVTRRASFDAALGGERFDALVSCLASRTGGPKDAWAIDHAAHVTALEAAQGVGLSHMVLMSAICVQKPLLAFQHAKLAFEKHLIASGVTYSIVRPTALFKSLSGQIERVKNGKPFLIFGDGELTACKPISDADLGAFMAECLRDPAKHNAILPIGGPGPAYTLKAQGELLFELTGQPVKFRSVPVRMFNVIAGVLSAVGTILPKARDKAEFARIGRYYATESMLVLDPATGQYDANATPEYGTQTLRAHYEAVLAGRAQVALREHAVFDSAG